MEENQEQIQAQEQNEARRFGWKPLEEFDGNQEDWRDAGEFLKRGREINGYLRKDLEKLNSELSKRDKEIESLKETMQEFKRFSIEAEDRAYKKALEELKHQKREAIKDADGDRVVEIEEEIERLHQEQAKPAKTAPKQQEPQENPDFVAWHSQNPWYSTDVKLSRYAEAEYVNIRDENPSLSPKEILEAMTKNIKEMFPDKFGNSNRTRPSTVEGSSSTGRPNTSGKKSYNDLPEEAKKACDKFVKQGLLTQEQYVEKYFL